MILAKPSGLQRAFAQLLAGQYLPLKRFHFVKVSAVCEETAGRFPQDKVNSCVTAGRAAAAAA